MLRCRVADVVSSDQMCEMTNFPPVQATVGYVQLLRRLSFKREFFVPFVPTKHVIFTFQTRNPLEEGKVKDEVTDLVSHYFNWIRERGVYSFQILQLYVCILSGCTVVVIECPDTLTTLDVHSFSQEPEAPTVGKRRVLVFPCDNDEISDSELESNYYIVPTCTLCAERLEPTLTGYSSPTCSCVDGRECRCLLEQSSCVVCQTSITMQHESQKVQCEQCSRTGDPWICLVCGYVGCSRYQAKHAREHYLQHKHLFSMSLLTQQIWDYDSDAFVHRVVVLLDNATGAVNRVQYPDRDNIPSSLADEYVDAAAEKVSKKHINAKFDSKVETSNEQLALMIISELNTRRVEYETEMHGGSHHLNDELMGDPSLCSVIVAERACAASRERWWQLHNANKSIQEELMQRRREEEAHQKTIDELQQELRSVVQHYATREYSLLTEINELRQTITDVETNLRTFAKLSRGLGNDTLEHVRIVGGTKEPKPRRRGGNNTRDGRA
ncbi:Zn-finger in ubiquitin-hydrolases and other protein, putative [Trypanosoma equiperdum]|uniref:UBP-type domain-containing protein n=2 Tax=Trypanozoon TaxID=39700 RepID=Q581T5_TRYB2|nr:hypothetical protein, conserved [Trypanosoma brucei brucei TREU927]AAX79885.1 hypothetical protein, conserved [Trypanosoma brucei]AAZ10737.1 hypothetical protein, conserved [Trypanosoma brucei brucei TREU927]SCU66809.1 Zn-finger in ubiquitin-hydrolases and other protein, putative [Trypanosoma equiperdum]